MDHHRQMDRIIKRKKRSHQFFRDYTLIRILVALLGTGFIISSCGNIFSPELLPRQRQVAAAAVEFRRAVLADSPDTVWIQHRLAARYFPPINLAESRAMEILRKEISQLPQRGGTGLDMNDIHGVVFLADDDTFAEVGVAGGCYHFVHENGRWNYGGLFVE